MNILIFGIYRTDVPSLWTRINIELTKSQHRVSQNWAKAVEPKFTTLNRMIRERRLDYDLFNYMLFVDDDITLPSNFLDRYIKLVKRYDFALAQPARTINSSIHHPIVQQQAPLKARETRFVEIGPMFSIRRDVYDVLLPFNEVSPMGWGYDFVWPVIMKEHGKKMGIIDATPVDHSLRPTISYDLDIVGEQMRQYLESQSHLSRKAAYVTLAEYR